jgi:glutathione S-transferase
MADFTLYIGNKNYSSWSLRGWLVLKVSGANFEEVKLPLDTPEFDEAVEGLSPTRCVPFLIDHRGEQDIRVWDSLAITDYVAKLFPKAGLWPEQDDAYGYARSVVAEMHSGFDALRSALPMNIRADYGGRGLGPAVQRDVARIDALWSEARTRFGASGRYLFGERFTAADCFYAPVASRFKTYDVALSEPASAYRQAVLDHPAMQAWTAEAIRETQVLERDEIDQGVTVLG